MSQSEEDLDEDSERGVALERKPSDEEVKEITKDMDDLMKDLVGKVVEENENVSSVVHPKQIDQTPNVSVGNGKGKQKKVPSPNSETRASSGFAFMMDKIISTVNAVTGRNSDSSRSHRR